MLTEDELLIPLSTELQAEADAFRVKIASMMERAEEMTDIKIQERTVEIKQEDRPRMLVMAGSGSGIMQVG